MEEGGREGGRGGREGGREGGNVGYGDMSCVHIGVREREEMVKAHI